MPLQKLQAQRIIVNLAAGSQRVELGGHTARPAHIPSEWVRTHLVYPLCDGPLYRHRKGATRQRSGRVIRIESETALEQVALIDPFPSRTHLALKCRQAGCEVGFSITHRKFNEGPPAPSGSTPQQ